jgi:hypothetical protein
VLLIRVAKVLEYTDLMDGLSLSLIAKLLTGQTIWAAALGLFLGLGPLKNKIPLCCQLSVPKNV